MDRNGKSPLYYAARNGYDKLISVLQRPCGSEDNYDELVLAFFQAIEAGEAYIAVCLLDVTNET